MKYLIYSVLLIFLVNVSTNAQPVQDGNQDLIIVPKESTACEWNPKRELKPSPVRCGLNDLGAPNIGIYDCGKSDNCEDHCVFIQCQVI